ncbi:MAG TPA: hypothetical protein VFM90_07660 [Cyclobacteriaceae bacterium]|nr:hypothetical protein [Cyclobacteriaceae bacterium]
MKKLLLLCLALLMPVFVYLFLKTFGKNEFEVPVLFADSVTAPVGCNEYAYKPPYLIPDSVLQRIGWNPTDSLTLLVFEDTSISNQHERRVHITRVFTAFKTEPLQVVKLYPGTVGDSAPADRLATIRLEEETYTRLRTCVFLLGRQQDAVILDRHKRIRGQYNLLKREDADRMIMEELNILFEKY